MLFQAGEEVVARPVLLVLEAAGRRGVAADRLLQDTGLDSASLANPLARLPWPAFRTFLSNARRELGEDGLVEVGRFLPASRVGRMLAGNVALLSNPVDLYRLICRPNTGLIEFAVACSQARLVEPAPDKLEIEIRYIEGYSPCPDLHAVWSGIFESLPRFVGFPPATASIEPLPGGVRFELSLPIRPDHWKGRLRQSLRKLRTRRIPREQLGWALLELGVRSQQLARTLENQQRDRLSRTALEDRFAKTFHASPTAISLMRESDQMLVDVNESFLHLIGLRRGEVIGVKAGKAPWCTPTEIARLGEAGRKDPHFRDVTYSLQRPGGEVRYGSLSREPVLIDGEPHVIWQAIDVTERERTNDILRDAEQTYFDLYENAPDMFALVDLSSGIIRRCNRKLCETLGVGRSSLVGSPIAAFFESESPEKLRAILGELWQTGSLRDRRLRMRRARGDTFEVSVSGSAVRSADGKVHQTRLILRNLSHLGDASRS